MLGTPPVPFSLFPCIMDSTFGEFWIRHCIVKEIYSHPISFSHGQVLDMMSIGHRKRIFASLRRGREEDSQHDVIDHLPTATGVSSFSHWLITFNGVLLRLKQA